MPQYFALKPLRLATVQIQAWQDRRNNKAVAGGNTEIGDVNESAALAAVARLQAELGVPVASLLTLPAVIEYLDLKGGQDNHLADINNAIRAYQADYCEQVKTADPSV